MNNFRKINKEEYRNLLDKALFKTFFHSIEWQEFLQKEFKWLKFEYFLYKDEFIFPIAKVGNKSISLPFCEYGGPLPLKQGFNLDEFIKDVLSEFGKNIKIKFHPAILKFAEVRPPLCGGLTSDVSTHWIEDLNNISEQEIFSSFRKTLRHEIQNAQKHEIEIKKCSSLKELEQFYNLYVDNLRRKKTIPYPYKVIQFLYENPSTEVLLAFYKKKIIAGDVFLRYSGFVHYFLSASDYKYRSFGAAHLLLWTKIKSLIGKDVIFDLGATPKDSSLNIFKSGWGGKEYPILQIGIKRSAETLRSSKLRNILGLLPNFVVKILSQHLIKYRL